MTSTVIEQQSTKTMATSLTQVMADTFALAVKTHGAHWNVRGPGFFRLHLAFEEQYKALYEAADVLAERIRALGSEAPGSLQEILAHTGVAEPESDEDVALVRALRDDHRALSESCRKSLEEAQRMRDEATADMLITRVEEHDKTAWMLSATLGES